MGIIIVTVFNFGNWSYFLIVILYIGTINCYLPRILLDLLWFVKLMGLTHLSNLNLKTKICKVRVKFVGLRFIHNKFLLYLRYNMVLLLYPCSNTFKEYRIIIVSHMQKNQWNYIKKEKKKEKKSALFCSCAVGFFYILVVIIMWMITWLLSMWRIRIQIFDFIIFNALTPFKKLSLTIQKK